MILERLWVVRCARRSCSTCLTYLSYLTYLSKDRDQSPETELRLNVEGCGKFVGLTVPEIGRDFVSLPQPLVRRCAPGWRVSYDKTGC